MSQTGLPPAVLYPCAALGTLGFLLLYVLSLYISVTESQFPLKRPRNSPCPQDEGRGMVQSTKCMISSRRSHLGMDKNQDYLCAHVYLRFRHTHHDTIHWLPSLVSGGGRKKGENILKQLRSMSERLHFFFKKRLMFKPQVEEICEQFRRAAKIRKEGRKCFI